VVRDRTLTYLACDGRSHDTLPETIVTYPHQLTARFHEHIEPIDRGERYEDPLENALKASSAGAVTGGGSQLNEQGWIEYAEVEIELADLDDALALTIATLEEAGAPEGSELIVAGEVISEFGRMQCLAIHLDGVSLPDDVYANLDFLGMVSDLEGATGPDTYRGFAQGREETGLFFFGSDAEAMFTTVEPVLRRLPIGQNARVVIRHGREALSPRTVRMPRH